MRIIAGSLGGRTITSPPGHRTHPMSEKIRGALFNTLGDISGLSLLDAYAGSGAIALEALSRGAARATAIDIDPKAVATIRHNAATLGIQNNLTIVRANAASWSERQSDQRFDIVICDPPYQQINHRTLEQLLNHLKPEGIGVVSLPPDFKLTLPENITIQTVKNYGDASLSFIRLSSEAHSSNHSASG